MRIWFALFIAMKFIIKTRKNEVSPNLSWPNTVRVARTRYGWLGWRITLYLRISNRIHRELRLLLFVGTAAKRVRERVPAETSEKTTPMTSLIRIRWGRPRLF